MSLSGATLFFVPEFGQHKASTILAEQQRDERGYPAGNVRQIVTKRDELTPERCGKSGITVFFALASSGNTPPFRSSGGVPFSEADSRAPTLYRYRLEAQGPRPCQHPTRPDHCTRMGLSFIAPLQGFCL